MSVDLGRIGVWSAALRFGHPSQVASDAAELESLGYNTLWVPGGANDGTLDACRNILEATTSVKVATGIVNIWVEDAIDIAAQHADLRAAHGDRFLLGIGISHGPLIGSDYKKPLTAMRSYLDRLDGAPQPVPQAERVLGALGPKALELARERTAGTHPYLVPPEHTAVAREALGDKLVAPEQTVVFESDPDRARAAGRDFLEIYLGLPNYTNNLRRLLGLDDADFADGGSDRLVDAVVAWGDEEAITARIGAHFDAGADHVCVQVPAPIDHLPMDTLRALAPALTGQQASTGT